MRQHLNLAMSALVVALSLVVLPCAELRAQGTQDPPRPARFADAISNDEFRLLAERVLTIYRQRVYDDTAAGEPAQLADESASQYQARLNERQGTMERSRIALVDSAGGTRIVHLLPPLWHAYNDIAQTFLVRVGLLLPVEPNEPQIRISLDQRSAPRWIRLEPFQGLECSDCQIMVDVPLRLQRARGMFDGRPGFPVHAFATVRLHGDRGGYPTAQLVGFALFAGTELLVEWRAPAARARP